MRKYNISANLVRTTEQLYDKATSAVRINSSIGELFRTIIGIWHDVFCHTPFQPFFFFFFFERILSDGRDEHGGKIT